MNITAPPTAPPTGTPTGGRTRLLDAALVLVRARGWAGTTVDELCAAAGVTKGSFFHHFKSKEAPCVREVAARIGSRPQGALEDAHGSVWTDV